MKHNYIAQSFDTSFKHLFSAIGETNESFNKLKRLVTCLSILNERIYEAAKERHDALELVGYQANKNLGEEHGACAYVMSRCVDNREIFGNMLKSISDLFEGLMIFDKMHDDLGRATSHQWSSHFTLVTVPDPSTLLNNNLIPPVQTENVSTTISNEISPKNRKSLKRAAETAPNSNIDSQSFELPSFFDSDIYKKMKETKRNKD